MKTRLIILAVLTGLAACKKEKDEYVQPEIVTDPPVQKDTIMDMISASSWLAYRADVNGFNVWDLLVEDCTKDDTYRFYRDSTLMQYENTEVCPGSTDSSGSVWRFHEGRKKLIGTILNITDTAEILSLTKTEMKLSVDYNGTPALIYFKKP